MKQYRLSDLKAQHCTSFIISSDLSGQYQAHPNHSRFTSNLSRWQKEGVPKTRLAAVPYPQQYCSKERKYRHDYFHPIAG